MTLRKKLTFGIIISCSVFLLIFLVSLVDFYKTDRLSYVYEMQSSSSRLLKREAELFFKIKDQSTPMLRLSYLTIEKKWELQEPSELPSELQAKFSAEASDVCRNSARQSVRDIENERFWLICDRKDGVYTLNVYPMDTLVRIFEGQKNFRTDLISDEGILFASSYGSTANLPQTFCTQFSAFFKHAVQKGSGRETLQCGGDANDLYFSRVDGFPFMLVMYFPKSMMDRAALPFIYKGAISFLALLLVVFLTGQVLSHSLTQSLNDLIHAVRNVGKGDFHTKVVVRSKDEVGQLGQAFVEMSQALENLMSDKAAQAANQHEMKIASDLQKKFLGATDAKWDHVEVAGYYEPASECGGDFWYYKMTAQGLFVCAGDVTGHGFQAALVTSAVRSLLTEVGEGAVVLNQLVERLNRATYETTGGSFQMTFTALLFEPDFSRVHYCNASHEPVWFYNASDVTLDKHKLYFLDTVHGPRLGQTREYEYRQDFVDLKGEEVFLLYTDGLKDVQNAEGKSFGDRRLMKTLVENHQSQKLLHATGGRASTLREFIRTQLAEFRGETKLPDDVSYLVVKVLKG